ncbi:TPA: hypothetical protein DCE37_19770 [Candidatus Latescibacteria bacterium]|nr:hypothetical protein [Candidatus Latescibacterota bacterium]
MGWYFHTEVETKGTVIHLHGSDGNTSYTAGDLLWLLPHSYNLFACDDQGYGRSSGSPIREGVVSTRKPPTASSVPTRMSIPTV